MGDFKLPRSKAQKRHENIDFLQPAKKPGFSVSQPGSFKNSFYWKTLDAQEASGSDEIEKALLPAPVTLPPAEMPEIREGRGEVEETIDGDSDRKAHQYQELVDECSQRSAKIIENISKWLMEVDQDTLESSKECDTSTDISDTSWLKEFHGDDQNSTSFNMDTQLLNDITGGSREQFFQRIHFPEDERTEELSLSPILDMIEANSVDSICEGMNPEEPFW